MDCPVPLGKAKSCADAVKIKRLEYTLQFCSLTILYFDYILTLPDEIKYIWLRKWRWSTMFYFFCRYALVANVLYVLAISEDSTGVNCNTGYMVCGVLSIFGHIGIIAVWTLRTCAVYFNNKYLLAFFIVMGLTVTGILTYRVPYMRCTGMRDLSKLLGANAAIFLSVELISFLLATWRVWKTSRATAGAGNSNSNGNSNGNGNGGSGGGRGTGAKLRSLNDIILAQGFLYIAGIAGISVGQLVLSFVAKTGFISRLLNGLKLPISGFLTARFMLKLRAWNGPKNATEDEYEYATSSHHPGGGNTLPTATNTTDTTPDPGARRRRYGRTKLTPMQFFEPKRAQEQTLLDEFNGDISSYSNSNSNFTRPEDIEDDELRDRYNLNRGRETGTGTGTLTPWATTTTTPRSRGESDSDATVASSARKRNGNGMEGSRSRAGRDGDGERGAQQESGDDDGDFLSAPAQRRPIKLEFKT